MQIVYAPGCFDLLHTGHVTFLERAKGLGDRLIVGVPSDDVVKEDKGKPPIICLEQRVGMLRALKCVDVVVPYYALEFLTHIYHFKPSIFVVGSQWGNLRRHKDAEEALRTLRIRIIKMPYTDSISTTIIKERIINERK